MKETTRKAGFIAELLAMPRLMFSNTSAPLGNERCR
jgi:hypothetical protein